MTLFLLLLLGHLLGDFVFQPGRLVVAKRSSIVGQVLHVAIIVVCTAGVLAHAIARAWPAVIASGAAHLAIENMSVPARNDGRHSGTLVFALDQGLHLLSLVIISLLLPVSVPVGIAGIAMTLPQLAFVDGVIAASTMGAILAFELRVSTQEDAEESVPLLAFDFARVYGMLERAAALSIGVLSPYPAAGLAVFVPRIVFAWNSPPARRARHLSEAAVGAALCTAIWLLVATVAWMT
ncbi:MAG: DUF3307 domain-containing protein [Coriobacteriia bacterium]|nr:DUF3307 domain-containing protein [Coriobacteriia bacterium]